MIRDVFLSRPVGLPLLIFIHGYSDWLSREAAAMAFAAELLHRDTALTVYGLWWLLAAATAGRNLQRYPVRRHNYSPITLPYGAPKRNSPLVNAQTGSHRWFFVEAH